MHDLDIPCVILYIDDYIIIDKRHIYTSTYSNKAAQYVFYLVWPYVDSLLPFDGDRIWLQIVGEGFGLAPCPEYLPKHATGCRASQPHQLQLPAELLRTRRFSSRFRGVLGRERH